jgi:hypothetical protein
MSPNSGRNPPREAKKYLGGDSLMQNSFKPKDGSLEKEWIKSSGKYFGKAQSLPSTNGRGGKRMAKKLHIKKKTRRGGQKSKKG